MTPDDIGGEVAMIVVEPSGVDDCPSVVALSSVLGIRTLSF